MSDSLKFQLELVDKLTKPGKEMAAQMQKIKLQLQAAQQAVKQTEAALSKLQRAKVVDIASYKQLTSQLSQQKAAVSGLRNQVLDQAGAMQEAGSESEMLAGALGGVAAAAAVAAAAMGAAAVGGMALSISAAEAKNDTLDALEAFVDTAGAANAVYDRVNNITSDIAMSQARGTELARDLSAAGVTNADALTDAIKSIGMVESVLGSGAGSKIQGIIEKATAGGKFQMNAKQLKGTGLQMSGVASALGITPKQLEAQMKAGKISAEKGITALTKAIDTKFGGVAAKQVLDFGAQIQHAKDNFTKLFEDVDTNGFLGALKDVLSVLDQNTSAGKALKFVVTSVFDGLFAAVAAVAPFVKAFFKGLVIIALQIYIAFKPLIKTIKDAFGGSNQSSVDSFAEALSQIGQILGGVITAAIPLLQAMFKYMMAVWQAVSFVAGIFWDWQVAVIGVVTDILGFLANIGAKFYDIGASIVTGLVDGIKSMVSAPADALKNMASSALDSFRGVFGIHSPSKVMAQMGGHLMGGLEQGIDKNSASAQGAMSEAVAPPQASASGSASSGGGGMQISFEPGSIVISGVQNAQQVAEMLPEMLADAMEKIMLEKGIAA
jgi:hypothetical protein